MSVTDLLQSARRNMGKTKSKTSWNPEELSQYLGTVQQQAVQHHYHAGNAEEVRHLSENS